MRRVLDKQADHEEELGGFYLTISATLGVTQRNELLLRHNTGQEIEGAFMPYTSSDEIIAPDAYDPDLLDIIERIKVWDRTRRVRLRGGRARD